MKIVTCSLWLLLAVPVFAQTHPFSADMADTDKHGGTNQSKAYVGINKMRMEGTKGQPTTIVDYGNLTMYVLMEKGKMYMQMKMQDSKGQIPPNLALLFPVEPNNPCSQVKKIITDLTCKKIAAETLNGRNVEKWEANSAHGEKGFLWFDPKLQFVVKMDNPDHLIEFRNIQEGAQPETLFNVPSDYRKMN